MLLKNRVSILFLHYNTSDVTVNNYNLLKQYNPTKNVYPVGFSGCNLLDGSHEVNKSSTYPSNSELDLKINRPYWSEADLLIYDFYLKYPNLPVYYIFEWDTYCNCSLEEFYGDTLNSLSNFSHMTYTSNILQNWVWYQLLSDSQKLTPNIAGIGPTSGLLFTKSVLSSMVNKVLSSPRSYDNMFSELRLGTLLQQCGYILQKPFTESEKYINWKYENITFDKNIKGYYHPIKTIV